MVGLPKPYYQAPDATLYVGDVRDVLRGLPAESVHCAVTSPPYWGLRDYGNPPSVWGGEPKCQHEWGPWQEKHDEREGVTAGKTRTTDRYYGDESRRFDGNHQKHTAGTFCQHCGAWLGCLGLEPTPELYVEHMVEVFREVTRVLRSDGVCWLNLGDSYAGSGRGPQGATGLGNHSIRQGWDKDPHGPRTNKTDAPLGYKAKDLVGIPWMVAFALRTAGWYLRSDLIWAKNNCMPESVQDRPTRSHEYIFLLTKRARYYYDAESIKEPSVCGWNGSGFDDPRDLEVYPNIGRKPRQSVLRGGFNGKTNALAGREAFRAITETRNRRSVWTISTEPNPLSHFATFPTALVEPCILAGCPANGVVLDPFGGSGTVSLVARQLGRHSIYIDLSESYADMAIRRLEGQALHLPLNTASVAAAPEPEQRQLDLQEVS